MKGFKGLIVLCGAALLAAGCALPLGEDYLITRDGGSITYIKDYNLQTYVPIPKTGERRIIFVDNRGDLEAAVTWKDKDGAEVPQPFEVFAPNTEYKAEIQISAKPGYGFYPATPFAYPAGKINSQTHDLGDPVRTITVIYNSSDYAELTFITDYNLQNYVPVPLAGENPVRAVNNRGDLTVTAEWKKETSPGDFSGPGDDPFVFGAVYQAKIDLTVESGYRFYEARNFSYPDGTMAFLPQGDQTDPRVRSFIVTYQATRTPIVINDYNLTPYVPKPVTGTTPVASFAASQYTGTVIWKNTQTQDVLTGPFEPNAAYTAELTLNPVSGYTLKDLEQDFTHKGAETITNTANSGVVTITFSSTGSYGSPTVVYNTVLTGRLPKPAIGMTPVMGISDAQYSGTVTWFPFHHAFKENTTYKAVLTLNAASGYTFNGIGENVFSHGDAAAVTNPAGGGTVTITFPVTVSPTYQVITSFGPKETGTSALWLMNELRDDTYPLVIDLPDNGPEAVIPGSVTLAAGINTPAAVIINGHHRTLKINSPGTLLTVGNGVTLTLQNITLEGLDAAAPNDAPLVTVQDGGRLVLGTGAAFTTNHSTGNVGGVWVNSGGTLILNGGTIRNMSAASPNSGGGVRISGNGGLIMNSGAIGGENSADGNRVSGANSGGGVLIDSGTMTIHGGTIQSNRANGDSSGGGVAILTGTVDMFGGTIQANHANGDSSGGGVYIYGVFSISVFNQRSGIITGNTAAGADSGSGVYIYTPDLPYGTLKMSGTARVAENNKVFLASPCAAIMIDNVLSDSSGLPAASIISANSTDQYLLAASSQDLVTGNLAKFHYNNAPFNIRFVNDTDSYGTFWVGVYDGN